MAAGGLSAGAASELAALHEPDSSGNWWVADVLLGLSMLLVVFGEARARDQRLKVLRALTESIVLAQQQGGMMEDALGELQRLTRSKAAWFRLIEGGHLVATHAVGVSADFLREAGFAELTETVSQMLERGTPVVRTGRVTRSRKMRGCWSRKSCAMW